jgi:hypothetical protein
MKVGLFINTQFPEGFNLTDRILEMIAQVRAARDAGFASLWFPHHWLTHPPLHRSGDCGMLVGCLYLPKGKSGRRARNSIRTRMRGPSPTVSAPPSTAPGTRPTTRARPSPAGRHLRPTAAARRPVDPRPRPAAAKSVKRGNGRALATQSPATTPATTMADLAQPRAQPFRPHAAKN